MLFQTHFEFSEVKVDFLCEIRPPFSTLSLANAFGWYVLGSGDFKAFY